MMMIMMMILGPYDDNVAGFLPERDYVTFGYLLSQIRLSSAVYNVVRPTQAVETFGNISSPLCTLAIL